MKNIFSLEPSIILYQIRDALIYWVVIPALIISSGRLFERVTGIGSIPSVMLIYPIGLILILPGLILILRSIYDLRHFGEGTPNYRKPPKRLVREGAYAICRHPMFLGYDLVALGVAVLLRSTGMLLFSIPIMLFFEVRFLRKEEERLKRRFGREFVEYSREVPFLLPFRIKR
ncbi:MAG: isoprenylcysteine carboxylmethyltransferase family protein [Nitrospirae bacterium]|nr:MAG: isoprenylcysteine carboxylmethyltransferase family protein [Nitrospirota bacterium]